MTRASFVRRSLTGTMALAITLLVSGVGCREAKSTDTTVEQPVTTSTTTTTTTSTTTTTTTTTTQPVETTTVAPEPVAIPESEPVIVAEPEITPVSSLEGYWDSTYYTATAMGYTSPPCGASGNGLISGYSVASDYFAFGTLLYIESEYMSGTFRVDDCGVGNNHTIDFYFWDYSEIPAGFAQMGRVPISVSVVG